VRWQQVRIAILGGAATMFLAGLATPAAAATDAFSGSPPLHLTGLGSRIETSVSIQFRTNRQPLVITTRVAGQPSRSLKVGANDHRPIVLVRFLPDNQRFDVTVAGSPQVINGELVY
jgi:hypothetical protein